MATKESSSRAYAKSLDFEVESIKIGSLQKDDITDVITIHDNAKNISRWASCSLYEDMFTNFMTCEIALYDQDGFFLNRLRTDETIIIKFKTPDLEGYSFEPRLHYFYLYKIDPVVILDKPPGAFYVVKGISFEYFYNALRTFSKAYDGNTSDIVKKIYMEFLEAKSEKTIKKQLKMGRPTKHDMKFTFPYVNAVDAINHLASVSIDSVNPEICNYVFFENKDGFNFTSITEMIEKPRRVHKYTTSRTMLDPFTDFAKYFDKTISVKPKKTADKIIDTLDGVYGEYFAEYDLLYKSYTPFFNNTVRGQGSTEGKRYLDIFPKTKHLNALPMLNKDNEMFKYPLGRNRVCFTNHALYSEQVKLEQNQSQWKLYETHEEKYSFQRRSMMQQINAFSVEIIVPGNSDITVGDIMELDTVIYRTSDKDKYLSGRYLVTSVHHLITNGNYTSIVTISRDSLKSDDFDDTTDAGV